MHSPDAGPVEIGREAAVAEICFGRERALGQVERDVLEEAAEVVVGLRLAAAERVNRRADARRPVACEAVADTVAVPPGCRSAAPARVRRPTSAVTYCDAPGILQVGGVVVRLVSKVVLPYSPRVWRR